MSLNYRTENALLPVACNQCANIIFSKLTVAPAQATSHLAAGAAIDFFIICSNAA
jgi:hypothetical protein